MICSAPKTMKQFLAFRGIDETTERMVQAQASRLIRYARGCLEEKDLQQAGYIGLMTAAERYDPTRGQFTTYARWWVLHEMTSLLEESRSPMRLPRSVERELRRCQQLIVEDTLPEASELAAALGVSERHARHVRGLWRARDSDKGDEIDDVVDPTAMNEDELVQRLDHAEAVAVLRAALSMLTDRERQLICGSFGIEGVNKEPLREMSARLGLSASRAQQVKDEALDRLWRLVS